MFIFAIILFTIGTLGDAYTTYLGFQKLRPGTVQEKRTGFAKWLFRQWGGANLRNIIIATFVPETIFAVLLGVYAPRSIAIVLFTLAGIMQIIAAMSNWKLYKKLVKLGYGI